MGNKNQYVPYDASLLESPITFVTSNDSSANTRTNIDLILDLLVTEGADESEHRLFLDQMSPAARTSMYAILTAMKQATTV